MARCTASSSSWSRKGLVRNSTGTCLHGADGHGNIGVTGDKDHWKVHVCLRQFLLKIKTAQVGQADIEDDTTLCIGTFRAQKLARRSKVPSFEANGMQQSLNGDPNGRLVADHKNNGQSFVHAGPPMLALGARRKCELEGGSSPRQRHKPQLAAVSLHDRSADRQSHPHSIRFGSKEAIENMNGVLRVEAPARVLNGDQ